MPWPPAHTRCGVLPCILPLPAVAATSSLVQGEGILQQAALSHLTCSNFFPAPRHASPEMGRSGSPSILGIIKPTLKIWQAELMLAPLFFFLNSSELSRSSWHHSCVFFLMGVSLLVPRMKTAAGAWSTPGETLPCLFSRAHEQSRAPQLLCELGAKL